MSAQARMADALMRGLGGRQVLLRVPAPAVQGDLGEQLGLATPEFQDLELGPAVFRRSRPKTGSAASERVAEYELLVSAAAVGRLMGDTAALVLFGTAAGVVVDRVLLQITWIVSSEVFGSAYLYRLGLKGSAGSLI